MKTKEVFQGALIGGVFIAQVALVAGLGYATILIPTPHANSRPPAAKNCGMEKTVKYDAKAPTNFQMPSSPGELEITITREGKDIALSVTGAKTLGATTNGDWNTIPLDPLPGQKSEYIRAVYGSSNAKVRICSK